MSRLNEEQIELQDYVRRIARERIAERAAAIDATADYPEDIFELLRSTGLFTLPFPKEHGGAGSMLSACLVVEELGRVCSNAAYVLVNQWLPVGALLAGGSDKHQAELLPALSAGRIRSALAVTEPQSGSDVAGVKTKAVPVPGGYRLSGAKVWCTNASKADFIFIAARAGDERGQLNLYIVRKGAEGLQIGKKEDKIGMRGVPSHPLFLSDVFVPEEDRLPGGESGFKVIMETFNKSRPLIAARALGLAQGAFDHAIKFISTRQGFGQKIIDFQGMRWMLADMATQIEATRHLVYAAAMAVDDGVRGRELSRLASMSKLFSTEVAMKVATDAMQIFGASGISSDYPIGRYFRDAKVLQIVEGTSQIQKNTIGKSLVAALD